MTNTQNTADRQQARGPDLIVAVPEEKASDRISDPEKFAAHYRNKINALFPKTYHFAEEVRTAVHRRLSQIHGSDRPADVWRAILEAYFSVVHPGNMGFIDTIFEEMGITLQHSANQPMDIYLFRFEGKTYRLNPKTREPECI
jgi:hypothetical protein